jgi:hypothetical protein
VHKQRGGLRRVGYRLLLVAIVVASLLPSTIAQAASDEATLALERINHWRAWSGLSPLVRHPALDAAAQAHARYYFLNASDPDLAGMGLHREKPGNPGFTGEDILARAQAQGYRGSVNENIAFTGSLSAAAEAFLGTVNHRLPLLDPRYQHIGFGAVNEGNVRIEVVMVGTLGDWTEQASPEWVVWPLDGMTGVPTHFWGEAPSPFPEAMYPIGYPITAKYFGPGDVSFARGEIRREGQVVPSHFATGSGWLSRRSAFLAATEPLRAGTSYQYVIEGTADGRPFRLTGTFRTAARAGEELSPGSPALALPVPPGLASAPAVIQQQWRATDGPVASGQRAGWTFGPDAWATRWEPYAESPGGRRQVVYFDKARLEITDPGGDPASPWFVTSGLLVSEMVLGRIVVGQNRFTVRSPARVPLAGDPAPQNPDAPTYASLRPHSSLISGVHAPNRTGQLIREVLWRDGTVTSDDSLVSFGVTIAAYDEVTGHNIARPFVDWLGQQPWAPLYVVGRPIADPYWVRVRVSGELRWVLVQAFERRILTYTPDNDPSWRVEMGNVGRHYYEWRYGTPAPAG